MSIQGEKISHGGETLSLREWAEKLGLNISTLSWRLRVWPLEKALSPGLFQRGRKKLPVPTELTFDGRTMSLDAWAEEIGFSVDGLLRRIRRGCPIEEILKPDGRGRHSWKSVLLTKDGRTQNLTDWAKELGISVSGLSRRISRNPGQAWDFPKFRLNKYGELPEFKKWMVINRQAVKAGKGWTFDEFMEEVGLMPTPTSAITRKDASKPWGPGNVKWLFQSNSEKTSPSAIIIKFRGKEMSMSSWGKEIGIGKSAVSQRISKLGWSVERALTTPSVPNTERRVRLITWNGQTMSVRSWSLKLNIPYSVLLQRTRRFPIEEAFTKPLMPRTKPSTRWTPREA